MINEILTAVSFVVIIFGDAVVEVIKHPPKETKPPIVTPVTVPVEEIIEP